MLDCDVIYLAFILQKNICSNNFYGNSHPDLEVYYLVYTDPGVKLQVSMACMNCCWFQSQLLQVPII